MKNLCMLTSGSLPRERGFFILNALLISLCVDIKEVSIMTRELSFLATLAILLCSCNTKSEDSPTTPTQESPSYSMTDLAGTYSGSLSNTSTGGTYNVFSSLSVTSMGVMTGYGTVYSTLEKPSFSGTWSMDASGKITGGGVITIVSGSQLITANTNWDLQISRTKVKIDGTVFIPLSSYQAMKASLGLDLEDVKYLNSSYIVVIGESGALVSSTNGGVTWKKRHLQTTSTFTCLNIYDALNGLLIGGKSNLYLTTDGGATFTNIPLPTGDNFYTCKMLSHSFFMVGGYGGIWKTTDRGSTWIKQTVPLWSSFASVEDLCYLNTNRMYALSSGHLYETTDGGTEWKIHSLPTGWSFHAMVFADSLLGVAVMYEGTIARTTDGGATWNQIATGTSADLQSVCFVNPSIVLAGGSDGIIVR